MSTSLISIIDHYQRSIEKSLRNEERLLYCIDKLFKLPVKLEHLQATGVGKTVNALRKYDKEVGIAAKALVAKWKAMVAAETEDDDIDDDENSPNVRKDEHDDQGEIKVKCVNGYSHKDRSVDISPSKHNGHSSTPDGDNKMYEIKPSKNKSHKKHHSSSMKNSDSSSSSSNSTSKHKSEYKKRNKCSDKVDISKQKCDDNRNQDTNHADKADSESPKIASHISPQESMDFDLDLYNFDDDEDEDEEKLIIDDMDKEKTEESECKSKSESQGSSKHMHETNSHSRKDKSYKDKKVSTDKRAKEKESKDNYKSHKTKHGERSSSSKERTKDGEKDKRSDEEKKKNKNKEKEKERSSHKSKHRDKDKIKNKDKDKGKERENEEEKEKRQGQDKEQESSKKDKKPKRRHSDTESKSSDSSPTKPKLPKLIIDGIDNTMGTSFGDVLGMISAPTSRSSRGSSKTKSPKGNISASSSSSNTSLLATPSSSQVSTKSKTPPLLTSSVKLEPLDPNIALELPTISPNYKPMPLNPTVMECVFSSTTITNNKPQKRMLTDEEALHAGISSKTIRTKVYSGVKTGAIHQVPTLFGLCIRVLQKNIDALEYTGGVPFEVLKPVLERATPQQLLIFEEYNPYLMEDSDILWQQHCVRYYKGQKRLEMETWREMFLRCREEQEQRLNMLTENIKQSQKQTALPVRKTQLAYVDTAVKPPRNIQRKQEIFGTKTNLSATPAARVAALSNITPNVAKAGDSRLKIASEPREHREIAQTTNHGRPKKAPLMQKTIQFMKGRFKR